MSSQDELTGRITTLVEGVRGVFDSDRSLPRAWRVRQLKGILKLVNTHEEELVAALKEDLGVNDFWARGVEVGMIREEAKLALHNLKSWMAPESVSTPIVMLPSTCYIKREPFGTCLIISPWNYPLSLLLNPLIACVAAGNVAVIKPSEVSATTSALVSRLLPKYVDNEAIRVVEGAVAEATALLAQEWDHIFYTGSTAVGKIVHAAAAKHLTPVTLELGGKCPCIVADDANLDKMGKRVTWAKFSLNMGQSCISPDYILCTERMKPKVLAALKKSVAAFYTDRPKESEDVSRIINERHTRRLAGLLEDPTIDVVMGGQVDVRDKYMSPTIVTATEESKCMQDEIFGPILPVLTVPDLKAAIRFVRRRPKPLSLYVFSETKAITEDVLLHTSSGSACVNECGVVPGNPNLPFGGVQASGTGSYHGKFGFETFSHKKAVVVKHGSDAALRFPPYTATKTKWLLRAMALDLTKLKPVLFLLVVVLVAAFARYSLRWL